MSYHFFDPKQKEGPDVLFDLEVFHFPTEHPELTQFEMHTVRLDQPVKKHRPKPLVHGWYYWEMLPGQSPEDEGVCGPFKSKTKALEDARFV